MTLRITACTTSRIGGASGEVRPGRLEPLHVGDDLAGGAAAGKKFGDERIQDIGGGSFLIGDAFQSLPTTKNLAPKRPRPVPPRQTGPTGFGPATFGWQALARLAARRRQA
jgi:hypothetical protein